LLIIEIVCLSLFYQSNGAEVKKTIMNKLTILSTFLSVGLIQNDYVLYGCTLVCVTILGALFINAYKNENNG
jgi:hypothetical protein